MNFIFLLVAVVTVDCCEQKKSYENYKLYAVKPANEQQSRILSQLATGRDFDLLGKNGEFRDVMVVPKARMNFEEFLDTHGMEYFVRSHNLGRVLEEEQYEHKVFRETHEEKISFNKYYRYDEIIRYLRHLTIKFNGTVSLNAIGKTSEKRDLAAVQISTGRSFGNKPKPAILIEGGIHAREWISPATVLYIVRELVENPKNRKMIKNVDWHIIPVLNPDGYEYTFTTDRMWRKTRSKGKTCDGVDPNRNFDFHWGGEGTSSDECSQTYKGPEPFSEPETRAVRHLILKNRGTYKMYLAFHSYGNYLMHPWGYTYNLPDDAKELRSVADVAAEAIRRVRGTSYKVGSVPQLLSFGSGGSIDWAKAVEGIKYSYGIELPMGNSSHGFHVHRSQIAGIVKETFAGVERFHSFVEKL